MKIVNLTPHTINVRVRGAGVNFGEERDLSFPSAGLARVETSDNLEKDLAADEPREWPDGGHFDVTVRKMGNIIGLPEPEPLTIYVVSMPVAQRAAELGRTDVYGPDTGPTAIRENGQVVAVRGLVQYAPPKKDMAQIRAMVAKLARDVASETVWYEEGFREIEKALR